MRSWAKVLAAFPVDWRRVDQKVLFAVTALGGLFALTVAVWMVVGFAQYVPVHVDDARIQADAFSAISTNGSSIFRDGLPFMEVATYVVWVKIFGWGSLIAIPIVFSIALAVLTGYVAYRVTESPWAGLAALLLLASLPLFLERARLLPFYPATMFFGYAGIFGAFCYARGGRWSTLVTGIVGLSGALYSFNLGLLFLPIPVLYLILERSRSTLLRLVHVYGPVLLLSLPWLVWHWRVYGPDQLWRQRLYWMAEKGYLEIRNTEFWGIASHSPLEFASKLPGMLETAAGPLVFVLAVLGVVAVLKMPSWRWRIASLIALAIPTGALIGKTPASYTRYVYIFLPGLVLLAVYGFHSLCGDRARLRGGLMGLTCFAAVVTSVAVLCTLFFFNARGELSVVERVKEGQIQQEMSQLVGLIDDDRAVLGSRAVKVMSYLQRNEVVYPPYTSEEDFVTYLTWPSDGEVDAMMDKYGVGWVLIRKPAEQFERDYQVWLKTAVGQLPRHYLQLETSSLVSEVHDGRYFTLYRVHRDVSEYTFDSWRDHRKLSQ